MRSIAEIVAWTSRGEPLALAEILPAREDRTPTAADAEELFRAAGQIVGRRLTRRERRVLELRFVFDFSFAECSQVMRVSQTTLFNALLPFRAAPAKSEVPS